MKSYNQAEIEDKLEQELPAWSLEDGEIIRTYETGSWRLTLMLANAIGFAAEAAFHHPELTLGYAQLTVRLTSHDAGGITERDFTLAARIEALATWQPADDDVLPGNPAAWIT
jgi:4a-hydroxytetrahydrobiopterin dehydratase